MSARLALALALVPLILIGTGLPPVDARPASSSERWVSMVVNRIDEAERAGKARAGRTASVTVRLRIGKDGSLDAIAIEKSSGSDSLDERAVRAIRAAAPFDPPPQRLLSLEGYIELSFPIEVTESGVRSEGGQAPNV